MLSAVVTAKAQENCGFPGVAPDCVCPVTANPGPAGAVNSARTLGLDNGLGRYDGFVI